MPVAGQRIDGTGVHRDSESTIAESERREGTQPVPRPEEAVTVEQMVASFTINEAWANFLEGETGSLEAGKSADLVVLRDNILELPAERIHEAAVELTMVRGEPVFATGAFEGLASA